MKKHAEGREPLPLPLTAPLSAPLSTDSEGLALRRQSPPPPPPPPQQQQQQQQLSPQVSQTPAAALPASAPLFQTAAPLAAAQPIAHQLPERDASDRAPLGLEALHALRRIRVSEIVHQQQQLQHAQQHDLHHAPIWHLDARCAMTQQHESDFLHAHSNVQTQPFQPFANSTAYTYTFLPPDDRHPSELSERDDRYPPPVGVGGYFLGDTPSTSEVSLPDNMW